MKIMVLGGAGFLGSELVPALAKSSADQIQVLDTFTHGFPKNPLKKKNILPPISGNIRNYYDVLRGIERFQPEVVVHLAAFNNRPETFGDFKRCAEINYLGTANVIHACVSLKAFVKKVVFASSLAARQPASHYGIVKRSAEELMESIFGRFPELGVKAISLRFAEIYGNSSSYTSTSLVNFLVDGMLRGNGLALYGVNQKIDCLHIKDAVKACELAIKSKDFQATSVLDIGTGEGKAIKDLVQQIKKATEYDGALKYLENSRVPIQTLIADPVPAEKILGFKAGADFDRELEVLIKKRKRVIR